MLPPLLAAWGFQAIKARLRQENDHGFGKASWILEMKPGKHKTAGRCEVQCVSICRDSWGFFLSFTRRHRLPSFVAGESMCHGFRGVPRGAFGLGLKATGKQIEMILNNLFEETNNFAVFAVQTGLAIAFIWLETIKGLDPFFALAISDKQWQVLQHITAMIALMRRSLQRRCWQERGLEPRQRRWQAATTASPRSSHSMSLPM